MIRIAALHNGPPGAGHGGVTSGRVAELIDPRAAVVRLHAPVPLCTPLAPSHLGDRTVEVRHGPAIVASGRPLDEPLAVAPFTALEVAAVEHAADHWLDHRGGRHPFPTCFACGPDRSDASALRLQVGPVAGSDVHAGHWCPPGSGPVPPWILWAALDCTSGMPALSGVPEEQAVVTGELAVEIRGPVDAGRRHILVSRLVRRQGRRLVTEAAVADEDGTPRAVAVATWFVIGDLAA